MWWGDVMNRIALIAAIAAAMGTAHAKEPDCAAMRAQLAYVQRAIPNPDKATAKRIEKLKVDIIFKCEALGK